MAERSVFVSKNVYPFFEEIKVNIDWFGGFALSQKRKCEIGLHLNFNEMFPDEKVLEVSSASTNPLGKKLSAMYLKKEVCVEKDGEMHKGISSVESVFQSSRVYRQEGKKIGPFHEYMMVPGKESKKAVKELSMGLHSYEYEYEKGNFFAPMHDISSFYDYIYMNGLLEIINKEVMNELIEGGYSAFSDLATVSLNSQARSCAIFVGLFRAGLLDKVKSKDTYLELFRTTAEGEASDGAYENVQLLRNGKVELHTDVIPCTYHRNEVEEYYARHYSHLSNKKIHDEFVPYWVS